MILPKLGEKKAVELVMKLLLFVGTGAHRRPFAALPTGAAISCGLSFGSGSGTRVPVRARQFDLLRTITVKNPLTASAALTQLCRPRAPARLLHCSARLENQPMSFPPRVHRG